MTVFFSFDSEEHELEIVDYSQVPNTGGNIQTFIEMFTQTYVKKCDKDRRPSWASEGKEKKSYRQN